MAERIKKGDTVKVTTGKDRGKTGKVLKVHSRLSSALVEGVNIYRKHSRPKRQGEKGELVQVPRPLALSNLMPLCPSCGKAARVGSKVESGTRSRVCRECGSSF